MMLDIDFLEFDRELEDLRSKLRSNREYFDPICEPVSGDLGIDDLARSVQEVYESIQEAKDIHQEFQRNKLDRREDQKGVRALTEEIEGYSLSRDKVNSKTKEVHEKIARIKEAIREVKTREEDKVKGKREALEEEISKESEALGFKLVKTTHGTLLLKYTEIDASNPNRNFLCEMKVENGVYKIVQISPALTDADELCNTLNRSKDLSGFVVTLRKRFLKLV